MAYSPLDRGFLTGAIQDISALDSSNFSLSPKYWKRLSRRWARTKCGAKDTPEIYEAVRAYHYPQDNSSSVKKEMNMN